MQLRLQGHFTGQRPLYCITIFVYAFQKVLLRKHIIFTATSEVG